MAESSTGNTASGKAAEAFSSVAVDNARSSTLPTRSESGKRLIYCSDGVIEESDSESVDSSDAEREMEAAETRSEVPDPVTYAPRWAVEADPKRLGWKQWFKYKAIWLGIGSLHCAEVAGEKFAWLFGITTPKYAWEIDEYRRQRRAEKEERRIEQEENEKVREMVMRNLAQIEGEPSCSVSTEKQSVVFANLQSDSVIESSSVDEESERNQVQPTEFQSGGHENRAYTVEYEMGTITSK